MENNALTTETQYANIDSKQIAYRKIGNGTPIILANRFRGTLDTWDPLFLDLLAQTNTVITFDYSGIGYSEGELPLDLHLVSAEVIKIADYLNIGKFIVGGWSYGGLIAQYVTFLYPTRVLSTVIIGSNPMGKNETSLSPLFLEKALQPSYTPEDIITLFFEPKSEESAASGLASLQRIAQRYDESKVPIKVETLQRYFAPTEQLANDIDNFREAYKTLKTPVLVISGDNDISFAAENWFPLLQNAPTLQHIIMPNTGHAPHYQYPELTTSYIKIFINQNN
ncbi:alpha/beta fold hydrolase [Chryseobacterium gambrini]|uniref:Pimeloyl-ACP methyl ester carboxylesterase n=1 Tax=Chryseobacterium gambrini TaxID=373672 RepID=A0A1N7MK54_9FLAO|nr:alpha/beta hydrolase [Chryseobacterium gambrini]SIS86378.1 Pimeloyl-ACP methyl ester carboxylesterase [Chryseobacterium gambrini]